MKGDVVVIVGVKIVELVVGLIPCVVGDDVSIGSAEFFVGYLSVSVGVNWCEVGNSGSLDIR